MFGFVIIHYKNIDDTIECIKSIKKLDNSDNISIVVVDNNTLNKNDKTKIEKYTNDIICLNNNIGYAKANNIGCKYIIEKYKPDFILCINNDTIINQKNILDEIIKINVKYRFDVLGPKIITDNGDSINPFPAYKTLEEVKGKIRYTEKLVKIYKNKVLRNLLEIYIYIKSKVKKPIKLENGKELEINVPLHGCALVFSKKYYKKYNDVFYDNTFLYHEEEFLYQRLLRDKLRFVYSPSVEIFHKEGRALDNYFDKEKYKKLIFRNEEILKSLKLLEKVIENNSEI